MEKKKIFFDAILGILISILIWAIIFGLAYKPILQPAYASMKLACFPEENDMEDIEITKREIEVGEQSFFVGGAFRASTREIIINIPKDMPKARREKIKHEICHLRQFDQNRLNTCRKKGFYRFFDEAECYIAENLPDNIYKRIYGEIFID